MANKTKVIHVAVEPALNSRLKAVAREKHIPVAQLIREAVRQYIEPKPVQISEGQAA